MHRRPGLLDDIPDRRLIRGVVIVRTEDAAKVVGLLEEMGADVHARMVGLTREDRDSWAVASPEGRGSRGLLDGSCCMCVRLQTFRRWSAASHLTEHQHAE